MMTHYIETKRRNPDAFLLYRLGDFYEMFFDDAKEVSKLLDITLTGRDCGLSERAPMCGVPYHAVDGYINKLIKLGHKVAICEQLTNPEDQKGILKRDIIRVITPGTITEDSMLDASSNNYLMSVYSLKNDVGLAWLDISTGELNVAEILGDTYLKLEDNLLAIRPSEIIAHSVVTRIISEFESVKASNMVRPVEYYDYAYDIDSAERIITRFYKIHNISALGLDDNPMIISALGGLLKYVEETQKKSLSHIRTPKIIRSNSRMFLDFNTLRNLELVETLIDKKVKGSLLGVLDYTKTNMGVRRLKKWITEPLLDPKHINYRLDAIEELTKNSDLRTKLSEILSNVRDVERLCTKISYNGITPRECESIRFSIEIIEPLRKLLGCFKSKYLIDIYDELDPLLDIVELLKTSLNDNPPTTIKDGGVIRGGYNTALDEFRDAQLNGKTQLAKYEAKERELTGIKNLKIGYNRVFGYYLDVLMSQRHNVPDRYERRQTLTSGERFLTPELKSMEYLILGAEEKALKLEETLYIEIKNRLADKIDIILSDARLISEIDVLCSLAIAAVENGYVKPVISAKVRHLKITDGRHPVVESLSKGVPFVANDVLIDDKSRTTIVTGPNMAGKSTYMRQVAIIVLMAHMGSFVPARNAEIPLTDRIFTRIGAGDNLAYGQSTFMMEMTEVANILNNATKDSLLILDEIGRGTSFADGLSIALAIIEHITVNIKARTLFATHYHELGELEGTSPSIKNLHILIKESDGHIVFLYKIAPGLTSSSFGVEVASLAGVDSKIIERAKIIMNALDDSLIVTGKLKEKIQDSATGVVEKQLGFFEEDIVTKEIISSINEIDINSFTPLQAITFLSELKEKVKRTPKYRQTKNTTN
jgi:DNA mismatch repair protein MutS